MSEASVGPSKPYRHTKGEWSKEHSKASYRWKKFRQFVAWCGRRLRPMIYHPVAMIGTVGFIYTYFWVSHWVPATVGMLVSFVWPLVHPDSYMRHMEWRGPSFRQGLKIRYRPRRKFMGAKVLNKEEKLIRADWIRKIGDTTTVRFTMPFGDTVPFWQQLNDELASAFGKLEAVSNPYRRHSFTDLRPTGDFKLKLHPRSPHVEFAFRPDLMWRPPFVKLVHTQTKKRVPRAIEVKFLDAEPFVKPVDVSFLDLHRPMDLYAGAGPTGKDRDGLPYFENDRMSTLVVALTGGGKSSAERAMVYADRERVQARLVEQWGCDLAYGVELSWMEDQFARHEYGDNGPQGVAEFWHDVREVMETRLKSMRRQTVFFTPSPGFPLLKVYFDECLLLNLPDYQEVRGYVYKDMAAVLTNGRKAGVQIRGFTQTAKVDELAVRDKFKITKVGIMQRRRHVDMVMGEGAWQSGIKGELLDPEAPGIFYEQTEGARAPIQMRYGFVPPEEIVKLKKAPASMLGRKALPAADHEPTAAERLQIVKR